MLSAHPPHGTVVCSHLQCQIKECPLSQISRGRDILSVSAANQCTPGTPLPPPLPEAGTSSQSVQQTSAHQAHPYPHPLPEAGTSSQSVQQTGAHQAHPLPPPPSRRTHTHIHTRLLFCLFKYCACMLASCTACAPMQTTCTLGRRSSFCTIALTSTLNTDLSAQEGEAGGGHHQHHHEELGTEGIHPRRQRLPSLRSPPPPLNSRSSPIALLAATPPTISLG